MIGLLLAALVLATMPVYLLVRRRLPEDPEVPRRSEGALLPRWLHGWLFWVAAPVERAAARGRIAPELFNWVGLALAIGSGAAFAAGALPAAAWLLLASGVADVLDGRVARATGTASTYGAFLDSTLDRFAEVAVFAGIAWHFRTRPWAMLAAVLALGGSQLVSYARARGQSLGVDYAGGLVRRGERIVLVAAAALFDSLLVDWGGAPPDTLLAVAVAALAVASLATAAWRTARVGRRLRAAEGDVVRPPRAPLGETAPKRSRSGAPSSGTP